LSLKGNANELGTYECRWNNSRREARHKQFTVGLSFVEEISQTAQTVTISVSAISIGLFLIGMGIGIKFYIDKVNKNNWMKILRKPCVN
jgi:hypothetical protein